MDDRPRSWIRTAVWLAVVLALAWVWFLYNARLVVRPAQSAPAASELRLRTPEGADLDLADYRGKVVVVNLWASWCGPCRAEIPGLSRLYAELGDRGLVVLGVNVESLGLERVGELQRELGVAYPAGVASRALSGTFTDPRVLPYTWLVDRQGRVRASRGGLLTESSLRRACRKLLDES